VELLATGESAAGVRLLAVRTEMQAKGAIAPESQTFQMLIHRSDITGVDRAWAVRYQPGNVVKYTTGSKAISAG